MRATRDISAQSLPGIAYAPRTDATPETELSVLATVYKFVLFDSQAKRGDSHDLTNESTKERETGPDKKGKDNADLHGD